MKTRDEIQRAHDTLEPLVCGELGACWEQIDPADRDSIHSVLDTLCWILDCPNKGSTFQENMRNIEQFLNARGFALNEKTKLPIPMTKRPGMG